MFSSGTVNPLSFHLYTSPPTNYRIDIRYVGHPRRDLLHGEDGLRNAGLYVLHHNFLPIRMSRSLPRALQYVLPTSFNLLS